MKIEEKKKLKRKKIFDSARVLFLKNGILNVSVREIVRNANIAQGTFYLYFKDKNELVYEMFKNMSEVQLNNALKKIDKDNSLKEKLLLLFDYYIDDTHQEFAHLFSDFYVTCMNNYNRKQKEFISNDYMELFEIIEDIIKESLDKGEIKNKNAPKLAKSISASFDCLFFYSIIIEGFDFKRELNNYLDVLIDTLN